MEVRLDPKIIREVHAIDEVVEKVDVVTGDECIEEVDDANVVVVADHRESFPLATERCNDAGGKALPEVENQSR